MVKKKKTPLSLRRGRSKRMKIYHKYKKGIIEGRMQPELEELRKKYRSDKHNIKKGIRDKLIELMVNIELCETVEEKVEYHEKTLFTELYKFGFFNDMEVKRYGKSLFTTNGFEQKIKRFTK